MRLNQFIARYSGVSRRLADKLIAEGRVAVNGQTAVLGQSVSHSDRVDVDGRSVQPDTGPMTIMLNKPGGYICSRHGQGSATVYDLLPPSLHQLKPVGRLDKDSSGLLLLTNDGQLAFRLTHPKYQKMKRYLVSLDKQLTASDTATLSEPGVELEDGISRLDIQDTDRTGQYLVSLSEGRNRQIRRTFAALGYKVTDLHRVEFAGLTLGDLPAGQFIEVEL